MPNVYHPFRRDAGLALKALNFEERQREELVAFYHKQKSRPITVSGWIWIALKAAVIAFAVWLFVTAVFAAAPAKADTIPLKDLAQEIKFESALPMTSSVSLQLATNLLAAQAASPWLNSLDLSVAAVLRAIELYDFSGGPKQITFACCPAVWAQSTVAIDPNAGGVITPSALYFGDVVIATPEPGIGIFLLTGGLWLIAMLTPKKRITGEYAANHPFRK